MGKRGNQDNYCSMAMSDLALASDTEEVHSGKNSLDKCLNNLFEKSIKGSTREKVFSLIIDGFTNKLQHQFVANKCITLLYQCLNSIKRGSSKEIYLASRVIGLLAITVGSRNSLAHEIFEDSIPKLSQALKSGSETLKISSMLDCLAIVTFVGANDPGETERSMQIMWQFIHPSSNVVASKTTPAVLTAAISAWSFLLTTIHGWNVNPKNWKGSISHFSNLLDKEDQFVSIAAGEAIALIFEIGTLEKFSSDSSVHEENVQGLKGKILNQATELAVEAGGRSSDKKDIGSQRNLFQDVLEFLEDGYCPKTSIKIGGDILNLSTWSQLIQVNFLKRFLAGGFVKHMQENELLHDFLEFTPKRKQPVSNHEQHSSSSEKVTRSYFLPEVRREAIGFKRLYKSPNSVLNKARSQLLNEKRMLSQGRKAGHYAVGTWDEEA